MSTEWTKKISEINVDFSDFGWFRKKSEINVDISKVNRSDQKDFSEKC
jgi:hypothetical protein